MCSILSFRVRLEIFSPVNISYGWHNNIFKFCENIPSPLHVPVSLAFIDFCENSPTSRVCTNTIASTKTATIIANFFACAKVVTSSYKWPNYESRFFITLWMRENVLKMLFLRLWGKFSEWKWQSKSKKVPRESFLLGHAQHFWS